MKFLFFFIAVCPAALAAGISCMKEGGSWKTFLFKAAGWFYCITFFNMLLLYLRGWGAYDFNFLTVQFLFKYMLCSVLAVLVCRLAWKESKKERFLGNVRKLTGLAQKELKTVQEIRSVKFYGRSAGIITAAAVSFLYGVFGPLDLYFNNKSEFWFDFYTLLPLAAGMFLVSALAGCLLSAVLFRLNKKLYQCVWIFGFVFFLCSYVQGNFLTKHLPPLDGTEFRWEDYAAGKTESVCLWCIVVCGVIILSNHISMKKFYRIAGWTCEGISAVLVLTLCIECAAGNGRQEKLDAVVTTKNQLEMSQDENFVILLLDSVDTGVFYDVLKENPKYQEVFADFTYYPDTMGTYPYTSRSVPFILSGEWYENKEPFEDYEKNVYEDAKLFAGLESRGYELGVYEPVSMPLTDRTISRFKNVLEYDVKVKSYLDFANLELKLTGFKYAPFAVKKSCVVNTNEFLSLREADDIPYQPAQFEDKVFYDNVRYGDVTYTDQKCFKFIHIEGAHVPYQTDENVEYTENGTYEQKIQASVTIAGAYLEKLKQAGVFDNSVIVVMADHGANGDEIDGRQDPLLLVKGIGEKHEMRISDAPVSFEDLQGAFQRLMDGKDGEDVFEWHAGDKRERRYLWYQYEKDDHMVEYVQKGQASDTASMRPTGRVFDR